MKECKKCNETKGIDQFYSSRKRDKVYLSSKCKPCHISHSAANHKKLRSKGSDFDKKIYKRRLARDCKIEKIQRAIRVNLYSKIRRGGYTKKSKTQEILGCDFETFKKHIESQFTEGMGWTNYGDWHLDHITPASWAKTEEELISLNHYTNFQPLWAKDNLTKSNKYSG